MNAPVTITKQGDGMGYTVRLDGHVQDVDLSKRDAQALARRLRVKIGLGKKRNAGGRMTKTQRRANDSRRAGRKRVAVALKSFLKKVNPGILKRTVGAKLTKNRSGSITITPIKAGRR